MATYPKLEALQTAPADALGWRFYVDASASVAIPTGDYFWESTATGGSASLRAAFQTKLAAAVANTTVTIAQTTGLMTITWGSGSHALVWSVVGGALGTTLRDRCGFTTDLSSATSHVGTLQARGMWLPNAYPSGQTSSVASRGRRKSDLVVTRAKSGTLCATSYGNRLVEETFSFVGLSKAKTWSEDEATAIVSNESAESFWEDFLSMGASFRVYPDRTAPTTYTTNGGRAREYKYVSPDFMPAQQRKNLDTNWNWTFDAFLVV